MTKSKYVVTITRQFGSLGRPIAKRMSEILDIGYYDRDLVDEAAKKLKLPVSVVDKEEESAKKVPLNPFTRMKYPLGKGTSDTQDAIFEAQQNIIQFLAEKETCIIVGRCGNYVLQDQLDDVIRIFVYADTLTRVRRVMEVDKVDEAEALRRMKRIDKERTEYHRYFTGREWMDMENYDLPINASRIDYDQMIQLIKGYLKLRGYLD